MSNFWMVRAGEGGYLIDHFEKAGCVAVGWHQLGDLSHVSDKEALRELLQKAEPNEKAIVFAISLGMISKFRFSMKVGDMVTSYDTSRREYLVGEVKGEYSYQPGRVPDYSHVRDVTWIKRISRDDLSLSSRNSLGGALALFEPGGHVLENIQNLLSGKTSPANGKLEPPAVEESELDVIRRDVLSRAHEFIKDRILELDWYEMQELVAAILRAMGYKTRVSPKGSDTGRDIVASPDGLGLEQPRIKVEVKHRPKEQIGADKLRSFLGGLHASDRGLYVSTGGFTKEAKYEAERATIPMTLLDLDDLAGLLVQHYDNLDTEGRALVPLIRVFFPAS